MSVEEIVINKLPLESLHERVGATFRNENSWRVPASYGNEKTEYEAVREGNAGLIDLSTRGRIRVSGSEAVMFLNGLITNDMKTLAEHRWMPAAFPNVQGRLLAAVRVARLRDEETSGKPGPTFLLDTESATQQQVLQTISRFTMAGDFRVADKTTETTMLSVQGRKASDIVSQLLGPTSADIPRDGVLETSWNQIDLTVIRASHTAEDGFDLVVSNEHAPRLWEALTTAGAQPVGYDALQTLRVEAGIGYYGREMDQTNVVTEANLDEAVSYTKGCYIGQEIIARIKYRGHVAKKLSGLVFEKGESVEPGATIRSVEGKDIGRITSVTFSPHLKGTIALGYVRYEHLSAGTQVVVTNGDGNVNATIIELPFVRGSWYESEKTAAP
jgi:folate-binding protein YgfZ